MLYTFFKNKNTIIHETKMPDIIILKKEDEELNTYYHIYSNVKNQNFSISKLNKTLKFYELIELFSNLHINNFKNIRIGDFSNTDCFKQFVEYKMSNCTYSIDEGSDFFDLIFFDLYADPLHIIYTICKRQYKNGNTIIKLNNKNLDLLYLLTTLFTKTIVCRPVVMSNGSEDYYIICQKYNNTYDYKIEDSISENSGIACNIPIHFINYANEIFVLLKQQFMVYKKNIFFIKISNDEKKENTINKNIHDCVKWCESYDIPYNEVKINIFTL